LCLAIDGDGMVCAVSFQNGHAHFKSKFVSTKHRQEECKNHQFIYNGQMGTSTTGPISGTAALLGNLMKGKLPGLIFRNPSNTNSFYWGGKVC
jgi:all-trans-8'-apo-beta-carotenal 15,15'-oxygenase